RTSFHSPLHASDWVVAEGSDRKSMKFTEVYLCHVDENDFRRNDRGALGTRTATLHKEGLKKLRESWVYKDLV
ncbi:hypothetical protein ACFWWA_39020, partial [Streptomyces goshikiensis]|uniref:hypothetical protein n=1 Tax=Streptomyces goshikiensis TaxID=1942 RepID=UPI00364F638B